MIEPLRVSLKSIDGRPVSRLVRPNGKIVANVFDDEYLWLFQQAPIHAPETGICDHADGRAFQPYREGFEICGICRVLQQVHFPDKEEGVRPRCDHKGGKSWVAVPFTDQEVCLICAKTQRRMFAYVAPAD